MVRSIEIRWLDLGYPSGTAMAIDPRNFEVLDDEMARVFRTMSGAERLKIASDMFRSARRMIASHLAAEHPDWDERRLQEETARRLSHGAI
jgi:lauroyl/myristoyl acyltransferase